MGIITETVKIIPKGRMIKYYQEKGYIFEKGDEISIAIKDLPLGSHQVIEVCCDICNVINKISYNLYNRDISHGGYYTCNNCKWEKTKMTNIARYGYENVIHSEEVQDKIKKTCEERYGYPCVLSSPIIQEKVKNTIMEKYNCEYVYQIPGINEKKRQTSIERYNNPIPQQTDVVKKKTKNTCLKKYNAVSPLANAEIYQKNVNTIKSRYNVDNISQLQEVKEKKKDTLIEHFGSLENAYLLSAEKAALTTYENSIGKTTSKQQEYIYNLYHLFISNVQKNYPIGKYYGDIVIDNLDIEIDYGGHNLSVVLGNLTQAEFNQKELIRDKIVKSKGYKIIRIISKNSRKIPSDEKLLEMLSYAHTFFIKNPDRSWISFDIDNSCIYNAYCKETDGESYDYGELRKIKESDVTIMKGA